MIGDNIESLRKLPENSIDSVVTDPPYGISFMNRKWDYDVPSVDFWNEVYRVLKPGGHILSFGGTRTYHRMVVNIEDARFEIRDQIMWLYGSGFPKSLNIGKSLEEYEGFGTALKPANEPICLARKPLSEKTIVKNVLKWKTSGLNIDGCRIEYKSDKDISGWNKKNYTKGESSSGFIDGLNNQSSKKNELGRFPTNLILDEESAEFLGDYSKFFYQAKVSVSERNMGLTEFIESDISDGSTRSNKETARAFGANRLNKKNNHPTVKPVSLMAYLCRLVTPPGGIVLDPYMGSGSTGIAALLEGFRFVGMEMENDFFNIAEARIENFESYRKFIKKEEKYEA